MIHRVFVPIVLCLCAVADAAAQGCPAKPVAEEGGTHWCYSAGREGHVHLWKPDAYDAKKAVTVVYVHGYNLTADGSQVHGSRSGIDGCSNRHYVDCAWDRHRLAKQFAASGLDALFVAVEGPVNDDQKPKWVSLGAMLRSIRENGRTTPASEVVGIGHSGGMFTVAKFLGDRRLVHVIALDGMYTYVPGNLSKWYAASDDRRLTLIGAQGTCAATEAVSRTLGCKESGDLGTPFTDELKNARCAAAIDSAVAHMDVIRAGKVLPIALSRVSGAGTRRYGKIEKRKRRR